MKCEICISDNCSISFDHIPSAKELIMSLIKIREFKEDLYNMKPWGERELMVLNMEIIYTDSMGNKVKDNQLFKFLFKESL